MCLKIEVKDRICAREALSHPFFDMVRKSQRKEFLAAHLALDL